MADIISHETFLFYKARQQEERSRRKAAEEHILRINALLGYATDLIKEDDHD